jgi:hypothetical protein
MNVGGKITEQQITLQVSTCVSNGLSTPLSFYQLMEHE